MIFAELPVDADSPGDCTSVGEAPREQLATAATLASNGAAAPQRTLRTSVKRGTSNGAAAPQRTLHAKRGRARPTSPPPPVISDSLAAAVLQPGLPAIPDRDDDSPAALQQRLARAAAMGRRALNHRGSQLSQQWQVVAGCREQNFPVLQDVASDLLPFMTDAGMTAFKVNHFCEDCNDMLLCPVHDSMIPRGVSNVLDLTVRHMASIKAADRFLMECGGDGDCFYHSIMAIANLFLPELYREWGDAKTLRQKVCCFLNENWESIRCALSDCVEFDDGAESVSVPIIELLTAKTSNKRRSSQAIVTSFATAHKRLGVQVECEIICAFAHFAQVPVIVTNFQNTGVHIYSANGAPMHFSDPLAINSPFHLYCNGRHYQAVVPVYKVKIRTSALLSFAFTDSNVLVKRDVLPCD